MSANLFRNNRWTIIKYLLSILIIGILISLLAIVIYLLLALGVFIVLSLVMDELAILIILGISFILLIIISTLFMPFYILVMTKLYYLLQGLSPIPLQLNKRKKSKYL